jgi:uncharacterized membrane protein YkoI
MSHRGRKWVVGTALIVAVVGGAGIGVAVAAGGKGSDPNSERDEEAAYTRDHLGSVHVTEQQAAAAALSRHPGHVTDTHLERVGTGLRWEVKPYDGQQVWEVQIDGSTGQVVSDQADE